MNLETKPYIFSRNNFQSAMLFASVFVLVVNIGAAKEINELMSQRCGGSRPSRTWLGNSSCRHLYTSKCRVIVSCQLENMTHLGQLVYNASMVESLNLSFNRIRQIKPNAFSRLINLKTLNLSHNGVHQIRRNAFYGLRNLKFLDLSFNSLRSWNTMDITQELPSLSELNVTENPSWLPWKHIRDLPNVTVLKGIASYPVPYLKHCVYCDLRKRHHSSKILARNKLSITHECTQIVLSFGHHFTSTWSSNFTATCYVAEYCQKTRSYQKSSYYSVHCIAKCLEESNKFVIPNMVLATVAMLSNFVVITTVFLTPLRKNVGLFLLSNMAVGDFLRGVWLFILTLTRYVTTSSEFYDLQLPVFCFVVYGLLVSSQYLSVVLGFSVTVERFICIVYSMKPSLHITHKKAIYLVIGVYILLSAAIALPLAKKLPRDAYFCANVGSSFGSLFIDPRLPVGIILYLICYFLYACIFFAVKKSRKNLGIQRDGKIAVRILLVISTNFVFGLIPMIVAQHSFTYKRHYSPIGMDSNSKWKIVVFYFFVANPCLNPFLFAFRNDKFKATLRRFLFCQPIVKVSVPIVASDQGKNISGQHTTKSAKSIVQTSNDGKEADKRNVSIPGPFPPG